MVLVPEKIEAVVHLESVLILCFLSAVAFGFYKGLLQKINRDRHLLLRGLFKNLFGHLLIFSVGFALFRLAGSVAEADGPLAYQIETKLYPYLGFMTLCWGCIVFVKAARIFAFEYLFLLSRRAGVPVLLVNILSLGISIGLASWVATTVFGIRLAPVLATSALISVILGLALQDTLGNLFAGIALQFDKPYEIDDWVEVQNAGVKWVGQVKEITWRSTVLVGLLDELITIPNRVIGQSEVVTWGVGEKPFWRGVSYRIPFGQSIDELKKILLSVASQIEGVRQMPAPNVYLNEVGDSFMNLRVVFCIDDYGAQFKIIDRLNCAVMSAFERQGISIAAPLMRIEMQRSA